MLSINSLIALNVYVTEHKEEAELKVYVSRSIDRNIPGGLDPESGGYELLVDAIVYHSPSNLIPDHSHLLIWRFVERQRSAIWIYLCKTQEEADISVYFSKNQNDTKFFNDRAKRLLSKNIGKTRL